MSERKAYPLSWPDGRRRTSANLRKFGHFKSGRLWITVRDATLRILEQLRLMGIQSDDVIVSTNIPLRLDGLPRSDQEPGDPAAAVYWQTKKKGMRCVAIDQYQHVADNLAAIAATLEALRAVERHGGAEIMEQAFRGFTALPERASRNWREVLGVTLATPTLQHIEDRFKNLAQVHHPDKGGDRNRFEEIVQAREAARLELAVMIFRRSRPREPRDHTHGFKDPRSRVLWRSGRTILKGEDKTDLRRRVFQRAGGRCEDERHGKRCNRFASWQGIGHGELSHREHGPHRGTLRLKNAKVFVDDEVSQP